MPTINTFKKLEDDTVVETVDSVHGLIYGHDQVIVYLTAGFCSACKKFAPTWAKLQEKYPDVVVIVVREDAEPKEDMNLAAEMGGNMSLPYFAGYKKGVRVGIVSGSNEQALTDLLEKLKNGDEEDLPEDLPDFENVGSDDDFEITPENDDLFREETEDACDEKTEDDRLSELLFEKLTKFKTVDPDDAAVLMGEICRIHAIRNLYRHEPTDENLALCRLALVNPYEVKCPEPVRVSQDSEEVFRHVNTPYLREVADRIGYEGEPEKMPFEDEVFALLEMRTYKFDYDGHVKTRTIFDEILEDPRCNDLVECYVTLGKCLENETEYTCVSPVANAAPDREMYNMIPWRHRDMFVKLEMMTKGIRIRGLSSIEAGAINLYNGEEPNLDVVKLCHDKPFHPTHIMRVGETVPPSLLTLFPTIQHFEDITGLTGRDANIFMYRLTGSNKYIQLTDFMAETIGVEGCEIVEPTEKNVVDLMNNVCIILLKMASEDRMKMYEAIDQLDKVVKEAGWDVEGYDNVMTEIMRSRSYLESCKPSLFEKILTQVITMDFTDDDKVKTFLKTGLDHVVDKITPLVTSASRLLNAAEEHYHTSNKGTTEILDELMEVSEESGEKLMNTEDNLERVKIVFEDIAEGVNTSRHPKHDSKTSKILQGAAYMFSRLIDNSLEQTDKSDLEGRMNDVIKAWKGLSSSKCPFTSSSDKDEESSSSEEEKDLMLEMLKEVVGNSTTVEGVTQFLENIEMPNEKKESWQAFLENLKCIKNDLKEIVPLYKKMME